MTLGQGRERGRGRGLIIGVLLVALVLTGITRQLVANRRAASVRTSGDTGTGSAQLSRMNSFALALLLGGLRGPLVMILWTTSEAQKNDKNLEDFDTKVEWIRLLQPEFDTVHIFQIWNKAYNISVQMASLSNKYLTIIDAIDYAQKVDRERPNNINVVYEIGRVFEAKLGMASENAYYRKRVREESLPHAAQQKLRESDPGYRKLDLDPMLDADGKVLPSLLKPRLPTPIVDPNDSKLTYDGAELQFLPQFEPFTYGISPNAIGFNYYKRAQVLRRGANQRHAQLSDTVIDSRAALALKQWSDEERELGRIFEMKALEIAIPAEIEEYTSPAQDIPYEQTMTPLKRSLLERAIFAYTTCARVAQAADVEFDIHLRLYRDRSDYDTHRLELSAHKALAEGDAAYLAVVLGDAATRPELILDAQRKYRDALIRQALLLFRYTPDTALETLVPKGSDRMAIGRQIVNETRVATIADFISRDIAALRANNAYNEEAQEFTRYVDRILARLARLGGK